jgi:hypothetical protein
MLLFVLTASSLPSCLMGSHFRTGSSLSTCGVSGRHAVPLSTPINAGTTPKALFKVPRVQQRR